MSKYIDAEKLLSEIERLIGVHTSLFGALDEVAMNLDYIKKLIISLQQEQPEGDIEKEIVEHAINMPHSEFAHDSECREDEEWAMKEFRYFYELGLNSKK